MDLRSDSFRPYDFLQSTYAFAAHDPATHARLAPNRNPHLAWSASPVGARSLVILCVDPDVPSEGSRVNKDGMTVPVWLPRADFFHWVLIDLPPELREIAAGSHSDGVVPHGKPPGPSPSGGVQGLNDYTSWFEGNSDMSGIYAGYDGPGPPWNDERVHGYRFSVHALDVATLGLSGPFGGSDVRRAMAGKVLASGELVGLYAIRP